MHLNHPQLCRYLCVNCEIGRVRIELERTMNMRLSTCEHHFPILNLTLTLTHSHVLTLTLTWMLTLIMHTSHCMQGHFRRYFIRITVCYTILGLGLGSGLGSLFLSLLQS